MDIKEMVGGEKKVKFLYYRKGELWYAAETGFKFPVPISDTGDATFLPEDRAILFMRYIRKQLEVVAKEKMLTPEWLQKVANEAMKQDEQE